MNTSTLQKGQRVSSSWCCSCVNKDFTRVNEHVSITTSTLFCLVWFALQSFQSNSSFPETYWFQLPSYDLLLIFRHETTTTGIDQQALRWLNTTWRLELQHPRARQRAKIRKASTKPARCLQFEMSDWHTNQNYSQLRNSNWCDFDIKKKEILTCGCL